MEIEKQPDAQQRQPLLTIVNRFTVPDNQLESEASHFPGLVEKTATVKIKTNAFQNHREIIS
jgi:hypothetical protein